MCHASNEKWEKTLDGRNGTTKCRKKSERSEKRKVGNIGSRHHQTSGDERKKFKNAPGERESYSKQDYIAGTLEKG